MTVNWIKLYGISIAIVHPYFYHMKHLKSHDQLKNSIIINATFSFVAFVLTFFIIPIASRHLYRQKFFGIDYNKPKPIKVPEPLGIVAGIVFSVVMVVFLGAALFQQFIFIVDSTLLAHYYAALASIFFMVLLGFIDDVVDFPLRVKLVLPLVAALPLLIAYNGDTTVIIPKPLIPYAGLEMLDLGWIYKLYMCLLILFCTNSINIYAGVNGLQVGQTVVIASGILVHNIMQIGASTDNSEYKQAYLFSIHLVQPLITTSLALIFYNWYPSVVFVGGTYTYFAGMTLAVAGILGQCSDILFLFFVPQVVNFILSLPQIAEIISCPRHYIPRFDPQTGLLTGTDDRTLVNYCLRWFGSMSEHSLCMVLLSFQGACSFGFLVLLAGFLQVTS